MWRWLVVAAIAGTLAGSACGRVGFDRSRDGAIPIDGALGIDDAGGDGSTADGGVDGNVVVPCDYMNCPSGQSTCCAAFRSCMPTGTCAGVETQCNVVNGQGCAGAELCCPSGNGGAICTPALCVP